MTASVILDEALKLPLEEREVLCAKLWNSLHGAEVSESSVRDEMQRRIQDAEEHPEEGIDWEDIKAEVLVTRGLKL